MRLAVQDEADDQRQDSEEAGADAGHSVAAAGDRPDKSEQSGGHE
jgi:hypothetical protein